ncbi:unnamed protein product [Arabidopsis thaliana]|nr:unnamed protein product [Arabidopsis thaliana]
MWAFKGPAFVVALHAASTKHLWYDSQGKEWRNIYRLDEFTDYPTWYLNQRTVDGIVNYDGNLVVMWKQWYDEDDRGYKIGFSKIALEKRHTDEIWGKTEWVTVVPGILECGSSSLFRVILIHECEGEGAKAKKTLQIPNLDGVDKLVICHVDSLDEARIFTWRLVREKYVEEIKDLISERDNGRNDGEVFGFIVGDVQKLPPAGDDGDIPLNESPQALFDEYLEDKSRVFEAMFPDKPRSHRLNEEEWRIQMLPINFLFLTVWPVVDMRLRCKSNGQDYPPDVPLDITKVLELNMMRWKLQGLDRVMEPADFSLEVKGALYPDRRGKHTRLRGQLEMNISFVLPPVLELVPEDVRRNLANAVLTGLVENMKHKVNGSLLSDYSRFKNERKLQR